MGDLGSEILKKYGTAAVVFAIFTAFLVWLLAHWAAAPGREVSVLWGFVKYTKSVPTGVVREPSFASPPQKRTNTLNKEDDNKQTRSISLPQIDLFVRHGVSKQNRGAILKSLRSERKLRELAAVESGKRVRELPAGTFFFLLSAWIRNYSPKETLSWMVAELRADRYQSGPNYFEIQNTREGELHLIGYMNEIHAADISKLSGITVREVMISPLPWGQLTSLVSIPVSRLQESETRWVQASEDETITALDVKIKYA
jgi:hypothetical protein